MNIGKAVQSINPTSVWTTTTSGLKQIFNAILQQEVKCIPYPIQSNIASDLEPTDFKWNEKENYWSLETSRFVATIKNT